MDIEQRRISGLSCVIAIAGGITSVDSRSDKRTQSGAVCSNPQLFEECELMWKLVLIKENTHHLEQYATCPSWTVMVASHVAPKQKDGKGCGIANKLFEDRSSLM